MITLDPRQIQAAAVVLPCADLDGTLDFFVRVLGFRVEAISPADAPSTAVIVGHGLRIRLERGMIGDPGVIRFTTTGAAAVAGGVKELRAPNGTRIEIAEANPAIQIPPIQETLEIRRMSDEAAWGLGRAGMRYRDLLPGRQGGRFIASHIQIPEGGPVPDYVHYHRIRFQMIYCRRGWVRVVYEDQGPSFVLEEGDCVIQPPEIRHRVLESSPGLEVIEIACPASHETIADHDLVLPTSTLRPARDFGGQRFVHHCARTATHTPSRLAGFSCRTIGFAEATGGLAEARVHRRDGAGDTPMMRHEAELMFMFVLAGAVSLCVEGRDPEALGAGDCFTVPSGMRHALRGGSGDLEILEVTLPAEVEVAVDPATAAG